MSKREFRTNAGKLMPGDEVKFFDELWAEVFEVKMTGNALGHRVMRVRWVDEGVADYSPSQMLTVRRGPKEERKNDGRK